MSFVVFFQTEEESDIQLVDLSFVISNPPSCLLSSPSILASFLRGAGIVLTAPQQADDGDKYEEQIVFQPENCQENLRILEALFTVLVKGNFQWGRVVICCSIPRLQELQPGGGRPGTGDREPSIKGGGKSTGGGKREGWNRDSQGGRNWKK